MNQRGFGTVALLALLPLFLTLVAGAASAFLLFRSDAKLRHECRTKLLDSQDKVAVHLRKLIALNPKARALRRQRQMADAAVMSTPPGTAGAVARARQAYVIDMQLVLAAKQRALIAQGILASRRGPTQATQAVHRSTNEETMLYRGETADRGRNVRSTRVAAFDVRPSPANSLTPDYEPAANFADSQTMRVRWTFGLGSFLPEWVKTWIPLDGLKFAADCSATIAKTTPVRLTTKNSKEETKWSPILNAVNR